MNGIVSVKPKFDSISPTYFSSFVDMLDKARVNTICNSGSCPNRPECFSKKHVAFMILGDVCTRHCRFCDVCPGKPRKVDEEEPMNVAKVVKELEIKYVVVTSVTRDDLPDGGSMHFVKTIYSIKELSPETRIEVLIPDFQGNKQAINNVINARPLVINHNIECARKIFKYLRPMGNYDLSLEVLKYIKETNPKMLTKSGFMVGVGEDMEDIKNTLIDLKENKVDIITVGQYLPPNKNSFKLSKLYSLEEFKQIELLARELNFKEVFVGPRVRSSYAH